jgi:hypothetical protein
MATFDGRRVWHSGPGPLPATSAPSAGEWAGVTPYPTQRFTISARIPVRGSREADSPGEQGTATTRPLEEQPQPAPTPAAENARPGEDARPDRSGDLAVGETVALPDQWVVDPTEEQDAIRSTLTYVPKVDVLPDEPKDKGDFGTTWGNQVGRRNAKLRRDSGEFVLTAEIHNRITIRVFKDAGPRGQANVESETSSKITKANYPTVVRDLTPDKTGRPPRDQFWCRDLTLVHEKFHADDGQKYCRAAVDAAQKELNAQTASSKDDVVALLDLVPQKIINARAAGMAKPGSENRAYTDGSAAYAARAKAIDTNGKANKYTMAEPGTPPDTRLAGEPETPTDEAAGRTA